MTAVPRDEIRIQSPCLHTPGKVEKYASRYRWPSASFQNLIGIDGMGSVMTNSPTSSMTGRPEGSQASAFTPKARAEISPSWTGSTGDPQTNDEHTSVPPDEASIR